MDHIKNWYWTKFRVASLSGEQTLSTFYGIMTGRSHPTGRMRLETFRGAVDNLTVCELIKEEMGQDFCMRFGFCKTCIGTYALGIFNQIEREEAHARVRDQQDQ